MSISIVTRDCTCTECETRAHSIPDTKHRRCPGKPGLELRPKHDKLPYKERGRWL